MALRIERYYQTPIPFNIEKHINKLLSYVPPEHLVGLDTIAILDKVTHKKNREAGGLYWQKYEQQQSARIELAITSIYRSMPKFVFHVPFVAKILLANALYHEIGHHYQHFLHGITKIERENFADKYRSQMIRKAFWGWGVFFLPFAPLIRLLNRKVRESTRKKGEL